MKKMMSSTMTFAILTGLGVAGYMMYKKKNPEMINDMKQAVSQMASNIAYRLEESDM